MAGIFVGGGEGGGGRPRGAAEFGPEELVRSELVEV